MADVRSLTEQGEHRSQGSDTPPMRSSAYRELIVNDVGFGRYYESARYDRLYTSTVKGVTVAATHNTPIAAATATPVLGLYNPTGSGKAGVLLRVATGTTSGTPAGGQFMLNAIPQITTLTTATVTGSIFSNLLHDSGASPQGSVMKSYNNVALTAIVPTASNEIALVGSAAAAAAAGNGGPGATGEDLGGPFIFGPNSFIALMAGTGAGTTWIVNASWTWAEIDWPLG